VQISELAKERSLAEFKQQAALKALQDVKTETPEQREAAVKKMSETRIIPEMPVGMKKKAKTSRSDQSLIVQASARRNTQARQLDLKHIYLDQRTQLLDSWTTPEGETYEKQLTEARKIQEGKIAYLEQQKIQLNITDTQIKPQKSGSHYTAIDKVSQKTFAALAQEAISQGESLGKVEANDAQRKQLVQNATLLDGEIAAERSILKGIKNPEREKEQLQVEIQNLEREIATSEAISTPMPDIVNVVAEMTKPQKVKQSPPPKVRRNAPSQSKVI